MKVLLKLDGRTEVGGSPLLMHNERLADPLDSFTRAIAAVSKKRNKTEADHQEIARLEFLGGLYTVDRLEYPTDLDSPPALPAWNILRCLQDGARRHKRGPDILRGVYPIDEVVVLSYAGDDERSPEAMWKVGGYSLRKTVGVQRSRTMRTRPLFTDWHAELPAEVDPVVLDVDTIEVFWRDAGRYAGIGDMRPIQGRFAGSVVEL